MKVSVSILNEYDRLISSVKKVNESNADYLHIDVMDGIFVDNEKFSLEIVKDIKAISKKPLDVHLMVNNYDTILEYSRLEPEFLTFHIEILKNGEIIDLLREKGIKIGLAINPETEVSEIIPYLDELDLVLFMSVTPGAPGQKFNDKVIEKIKKVKKIAPKDLIISIDGGVNDKTIELCKYAGCNMVVSGSFVTNKEDYNEAINELKS